MGLKPLIRTSPVRLQKLWGLDGNAAFSSERSLIYTSSSCAATVELVWRQTSIATLAFSSPITLEGNICLFLLLTALLHSAVGCSAGLSCAPAAAFFPFCAEISPMMVRRCRRPIVCCFFLPLRVRSSAPAGWAAVHLCRLIYGRGLQQINADADSSAAATRPGCSSGTCCWRTQAELRRATVILTATNGRPGLSLPRFVSGRSLPATDATAALRLCLSRG